MSGSSSDEWGHRQLMGDRDGGNEAWMKQDEMA